MDYDHKILQLEKQICQLQCENKSIKRTINSIPDGIFWKDKTGQYLGCNKGLIKIHSNLSNNLTDKKTIIEDLWKASSESASILPAHHQKKNIIDDKTNIIAESVNLLEGSAENQAHDIKSKSEHITKVFFENITESLPQYVFWKDKHSVYLGCNRNYAKIVGLNAPEDIIGKTDFDLEWQKSGHTAEFFQQGDRETIFGKRIVNQEEALVFPDGRKLVTLVSKLPIMDAGKPVGIVGYFTDITAVKEAQKQLAEEQKEKEVLKKQVELSEMIGATVAHEVRTPLGAVQMATSVIAEAIEMGDMQQVEKSCQEIRRHLQRANTFIETFLLNVKSSQSIATDEISSIKTTLTAVLENYVYPTPLDRALVSLEPDFIDFEYGCSPSLMEHVFSNLLKNALYFIKKAGKGEIQIWSSREDGFNCVHFKDTGFGIPPEKIQHIFDKFYTSTKVGTGVGLSFCKMIMDSIGGKIICKSIFGEFTEFKLYFPKIDLK